MEEVFGIAPPAAAKKESKGAPAAAKGKAEKNIALIDVKRSNNVAIAMARLRLPDGEIKARVCDGPPLSLEQVSALLSAMPTAEELETVREFSGERESLGRVEQLFLCLGEVDRLGLRLNCLQAATARPTEEKKARKEKTRRSRRGGGGGG